MTLRLHIERLVADRRALAPEHVERFRAALTEALGRLHVPAAEVRPPSRDAVTRLAERVASTIHRQMGRP
jgi:hypothetical protein